MRLVSGNKSDTGRTVKRSHLPCAGNRRMKEYKYLFQKLLKEETIRAAYKKMRLGKTRRAEIVAIDANLDEEVKAMQTMLANSHEGANDPEHGFWPPKHKKKYMFERGKQRTIYMPDIKEQWVHHCIIQVLAPIVTATAYKYSCGSMPHKGAHFGKRAVRKWIDSGKRIKYFLKADIRHFYSNIHHDVLRKELEKRIKDPWFIDLVMRCLCQFKKGIPLGFYISQWLANYLLEPLDNYIVGTEKKYMRYMDDIIIFSANKRKLRCLLESIKRILGKLRLRLKRNHQIALFIFGTRGRPLNFMGFLFHRDKTLIREKIMLRAVRLAKKINKSTRIYRTHAYAMISLMGWFLCTDTYHCYWLNIKPLIDIKRLKAIISKGDKNDRLENRDLLRATC